MRLQTSPLFRSGLPARLLVIGVAATAFLSLAHAQNPPASTPAAPAAAVGRMPARDLAAAGGRWAWLGRSGDEVELAMGGPGAGRTSLARGRDWEQLAVDGNAAWILRRRNGQGALLQVALAPNAMPAELVTGIENPISLLSQGGSVYWIEHPQPAGAVLPFVPAMLPPARLRVREASGQARTVAEWPLPAPQPGTAPDPGRLVAVANGGAYLEIHRPASTEFLRVDLASGEVRRLAMETGTQYSVQWGDHLYWTARSDEAMPTAGLGCVRRAGAAGEPEVVTDWLPGNGILLGLPDGVYYLGHELFRLPSQRGQSQYLRAAPPGAATTDGKGAILVMGDPPVAVAPRAEE